MNDSIGQMADKEKKFVTLSEAAKINNVTRQAIYVAIKQKKLRAYKNPTRWIIDLDDLDDYRKMKYSRTKSVHNGERRKCSIFLIRRSITQHGLA
jgi:excisionase family DNA binding protein